MGSQIQASSEASARVQSAQSSGPTTHGRALAGHDGHQCPRCGSHVRSVDVSEATCPDCQVVLTDQPVSRSPRPEYDDDRSKRQSGSRLTQLYADRGLGVGTGDGFDDDGKPWLSHRSSADVRLDYALGEIRRMAGALGVPDAERERAARLYREAQDNGLVNGRSMDGFASACLLAAVRQSSVMIPVSHRELMEVSRGTEQQVRTARGVLELRLDLQVPPMDPQEFLPRATSELSADRTVSQLAGELLEVRRNDETRDHRGVSPRTLAAAALHTAYDVLDREGRPQLTAIADALNVSPSTVSQRKPLLSAYRSTVE